MSIAAGTIVRIRPPFDGAFPGTYTVVEVISKEDGQVACALSGDPGQGDIGAFDPRYLERVEG